MNAFLLLALTVAAEGDQPRFKMTTKRDDAVEVRADKDRTLFAVKSPFGISQAVIERLDDNWPKNMVLRLHLKGLESFRVSNGKVKLDAAVSIQAGKPKAHLEGRQGRRSAGREEPVLGRHPHRRRRRQAGPGDPVEGWLFRGDAAEGMFEGNSKTITVGWIDFYRN